MLNVTNVCKCINIYSIFLEVGLIGIAIYPHPLYRETVWLLLRICSKVNKLTNRCYKSLYSRLFVDVVSRKGVLGVFTGDLDLNTSCDRSSAHKRTT